jgi:hypothetical protein
LLHVCKGAAVVGDESGRHVDPVFDTVRTPQLQRGFELAGVTLIVEPPVE